MSELGLVALWSAVVLGFVHTIVGVDHTLPFVLLARARHWSLRRTLAVTFLCGVAHVGSSVALGVAGAALGSVAEDLAWIEDIRGRLAAWLLIAFGLTYAAWSYGRSRRGVAHAHVHVHADGTLHRHVHRHADDALARDMSHDDGSLHCHVHGRLATGRVVPALFVIFVLGPCEPLIPLVLAPTFTNDWVGALAVVGAFATTTIGTMVAVVAVGYAGTAVRGVARLERHLGTISGLLIAAAGIAVAVLGI